MKEKCENLEIHIYCFVMPVLYTAFFFFPLIPGTFQDATCMAFKKDHIKMSDYFSKKA